MAKCAYCGSTVIFGGKTHAGMRFCSDKCLSNGQVVSVARNVPEEMVAMHAREIHAGPCPVCKQRRGPVDVQMSHKVVSYVFATSWSSTPRISCRSCGRKAQLGATAYSLFLGWWGIPFGLLMTPVQVGKNIVAMLRSSESTKPSPKLEQMVRLNIASHAIEQAQQER
jgi:hypothetical protein